MDTMLSFSIDQYLRAVSLIGSRYTVVAGVAFFAFYVLSKGVTGNKKIQQHFPMARDYVREIGYSIITILIFGCVPAVFIHNEQVAAYTTLYPRIQDYGWPYFFLAFPLMLIMHDTYFYWTHRMMHHRSLFKLFHLVHHQSTNPSPWAAYAFHPLEAVVEAGILVVFLFTIPIHKLHFLIFFMFMIIYNVYGHLGWEIYPRGFQQTKVGRWINTAVAHNQHHQYFKGNYSLYFLFWDRIMGTLRKDYEEQFEKVKTR